MPDLGTAKGPPRGDALRKSYRRRPDIRKTWNSWSAEHYNQIRSSFRTVCLIYARMGTLERRAGDHAMTDATTKSDLLQGTSTASSQLFDDWFDENRIRDQVRGLIEAMTCSA